ncbi:MAG: trk system potassium uptake protein TrkH [Puniceicoccaceae bacterium 5H]|nr:MAG: trk system potassium uptake protein TrkH [Puniceicoccaceae bacterium 5H]
MNYSIVLRLLGTIAISIFLAFLLSWGMAWLLDDGSHWAGPARWGFGISSAIAGVVGVGLHILGRSDNNKMFRKEALATIGLGWIFASVLGAIPYFLIIDGIPFADCVFEAASGFTTTGASVLSDIEHLPLSLLFWRSLSQWIGGLGVVVFFVALLSFLGAGAKVLYSRESSAQAADLDASRVQQGVLKILLLYLGLSALCTLVYWLCGLSWYDSLNHMFTTLSTGGFSTRSTSVASFDNPAFEWAVILFMTIGGASFLVILRMLKGDWHMVRRSTEMKAYLAIIVGATALVTLFLYVGLDATTFENTVRDAAFQVVSIMTTTGYATKDYDAWLPATHIMLLALMVIGGCSGSTAGGIKVIRLCAAWKIARHHVERAYRARVVRPMKINDQNLDQNTQESIVVFLMQMSMIVMVASIIVGVLEPQLSVPGNISAVAATLFNIGPGLAEVGPTRNFAFFHSGTKLFLSLLMILGRLELYAVLALFSPALWKKY